MGSTNKLLCDVDGQAMVRRVARVALDGGLDPVVVVTGHDAERVGEVLDDLPVRVVHNPHHTKGMSTSLGAGLAGVGSGPRGAVICLGDMPWVLPAHLRALVDAFHPESGASICVPVHRGKRGNPVLWSSHFFPEMTSLQGDRGARELLDRHAVAVREVEVADPGVLLDIDRPEDQEARPGP